MSIDGPSQSTAEQQSSIIKSYKVSIPMLSRHGTSLLMGRQSVVVLAYCNDTRKPVLGFSIAIALASSVCRLSPVIGVREVVGSKQTEQLHMNT